MEEAWNSARIKTPPVTCRRGTNSKVMYVCPAMKTLDTSWSHSSVTFSTVFDNLFSKGSKFNMFTHWATLLDIEHVTLDCLVLNRRGVCHLWWSPNFKVRTSYASLFVGFFRLKVFPRRGLLFDTGLRSIL